MLNQLKWVIACRNTVKNYQRRSELCKLFRFPYSSAFPKFNLDAVSEVNAGISLLEVLTEQVLRWCFGWSIGHKVKQWERK